MPFSSAKAEARCKRDDPIFTGGFDVHSVKSLADLKQLAEADRQRDEKVRKGEPRPHLQPPTEAPAERLRRPLAGVLDGDRD